MTTLPVRLYASFAAREFGGNIAGVVYDEIDLSVSQMQGIAAELGAPTTGFVRKRSEDTFDVRFFSTRSEMDMCGHVTVGIFVSMSDDGMISSGIDAFRQKTPAGEILVSVSKQSDRSYVLMKQRSPTFDMIAAEKAEIAGLLGVHSDAIQSLGSSSTSLKHLFVELADEGALARIKPDDENLRSYSREKGIDTVGVWCLQNVSPALTKVRVRDLCHGVGDREEAASGTTNGALASLLWRNGVATPDENGIVSVEAEQGFEMLRPSRISTRLKISASAVEEVRVGGSAQRRLEGQIRL